MTFAVTHARAVRASARTVAAAAAELRLSTMTLSTWISLGRVAPAIRNELRRDIMDGELYMFTLEEIRNE